MSIKHLIGIILETGEKNIALRRHIVDTTHQSYTQAANGLHNLTLHLQKSHIAIQVSNSTI